MLVAACNDTDPLPVFFDLNYQVGCVLPECNGAFHGPQHIVMAVNGEDGVKNSCDANSANGVTTVNLSSTADGSSLSITGAAVGDPGNVGSQCFVRIFEASTNNTYQGKCSAGAPSSLAPCQLSEFGKNSNGILTGKLYCNNIENAATNGLSRDVGKAGSFSGTPQPATFLVDPCNGL